jgi:NADPH2:quinone reductase
VPKAIRIYENGGPEVLRWEDVDVPPPDPGEVLLRHTAVGLNYADVNLRNGTFYIHTKLPLPAILGNEGAGVVENLGPGVGNVKTGDRVVYVTPSGMAPPGSYSELRVIAADQLVKFRTAFPTSGRCRISQGPRRGASCGAFSVRPGHVILIHAAAGSVYLCQPVVRHLGAARRHRRQRQRRPRARRVATTQSHCDASARPRSEPPVSRWRVRGLRKGRQGHLSSSLECLDPVRDAGELGNASGTPRHSTSAAGNRGSQMVTRMGMGFFFRERRIQREAAEEIFDLMTKGILTARIERTYRLREAAQAHRDLEGRRTMGSVVLLPYT